MNIPGRFATAVIVGGTVSEISGGKFANGAATAAFAFVSNELATSDTSSDADSGKEKRSLEITFDRENEVLTVTLTIGDDTQTITMRATSGGWGDNEALPEGEWLIVENPGKRGRGYFGLFKLDGNVNDEFFHNGKWRNAIRLGFHQLEGSHGCIMTCPTTPMDPTGIVKWHRIQSWVRSMPHQTHRYRNNESGLFLDEPLRTRSYGTLTVK